MTARTESPQWDRHLVARVPDALIKLVDNEATAGCSNRSAVVRKALRHYFNCPHVRRDTHTRPVRGANGSGGTCRPTG